MDIETIHCVDFADSALPPGCVAGYCQVLAPADIPQWNGFLPKGLTNVSLKRQSEFLSGRILLKNLLNRIGRSSEFPLPADHDGVPLFPRGVIGSLSHTSQVAFAIVGEDSERQIGCDIEHVFTVEVLREVKAEILNAREEALFSAYDQTMYATLVFSAKESLYKAVFPRLRTFLEFSAFELIQIEPRSLVFKTTTPLSDVPEVLNVHFAAKDQFVVTWTDLTS